MVLEGTVATILFLAALHSQRFIVYVFVATCGLAACLPKAPSGGRALGGCSVRPAPVILGRHGVPEGRGGT